MKKFIRSGLITLGLLLCVSASSPAQAAGLTEAQIQAILGLLNSFGADSTVVANVNATLHGQSAGNSSSSNPACLTLYSNLYLDVSDSTTGGEVSKLQQFLGGRVTGYFGPATLQLVQNWQTSHGIVSSGTADTTGFGYIGPKSRGAMACSGDANPTSTQTTNPQTSPIQANTPPSSAAAITINITYPQAGNALENSGSKSSGLIANIQWNEQSGNYPVNIWLLNQSNQIIRTIATNIPDTGSYAWGYDPALTDGTYQIRIDVLYPSGVSGQDAGYSGYFTISQSPLSQVPTIYNFSASATSISSGQPVTFSWSSSASNCSVLRNENNGGYTTIGANVGSATSYTVYTNATATYTLQCLGPNSGTGKDGPSAMKSLTISVSNPVPTCTLTETSPTPSGYTTGYDYSVKPNSSLTLTWTSQNATYSVWGSGDKDNPNGSMTINNLTAVANNYSLTFYGSGGSATCNASVYVDYKG